MITLTILFHVHLQHTHTRISLHETTTVTTMDYHSRLVTHVTRSDVLSLLSVPVTETSVLLVRLAACMLAMRCLVAQHVHVAVYLPLVVLVLVIANE